MKSLNPKEEKIIKIISAQLEHALKVRKIGVKIGIRQPIMDEVNNEAGRLSKYCTSPNRRLCNEALRLILTRLNPHDVEDLLRKLKASNYPPEVGVAYLAGAVLNMINHADYKGIIINEDSSISTDPVLNGSFTLDKARSIIPLNEPKQSSLLSRLFK